MSAAHVPLFWLSYADDNGFRGVVVLRASSFLNACAKAKLEGLSPGGQVRGFEIEKEDEYRIPEHCQNRCLTREEAGELA